MRKTDGFIYKITNKVNDKVYIGQTVRSVNEGAYTCHYCYTSGLGSCSMQKLIPVPMCERCYESKGSALTDGEWYTITEYLRVPTPKTPTFEERLTDYDRAFLAELGRAFA